MIEVMRLNGTKYWVNPHLIECLEQNPDVTLVMLSGKKLVVKNTPEDIIEKIINYRNRLLSFQNLIPAASD
ncbi:MAG: flagellar FlbD family protein [Bacteroides sp.]|nr:flagellar FlbD family protein [Prevotella sp.]MCM1407341.1 flagellar FlbD family protein [Treponema brennaborense]MCM1469831.1 flagellar FlbD family protein [Bacteroides sp.]